MPMNVSFDGGKTWISENDMGAVDREIQKMNELKSKKNTPKINPKDLVQRKKQVSR